MWGPHHQLRGWEGSEPAAARPATPSVVRGSALALVSLPHRGTMYRRLREFDAAVEDILKALDMLPEQQEELVQQAQRQLLLTYNDFAVHCYLQGAYQESVLLLNKALRDEQREKGLYINRGDCFFQLGNLTFAEADYRQALELSPQDEGANLRMGLLQEKMGFCEQKSRQFQNAESHFSTAIQHNPQSAQYYVHRARCRQLMQNIFGARQDIATALLLNPKQPKLLPLITSLFPGMSVEEVLSSQMACLARLQLSRVMDAGLHESIPRGIVGQLRKRELERQKAQALQHSWKLGQPLSENSEKPDTTPQTLQAEAAHPEEAQGPEEEEKPEPAPSKVRSLTSSYLDQTSSSSFLDYRTWPTSETETSTTCQEYRSSSASTVTFSDSSLLKTQSSDLGNKEDLSLGRSPRKTKAARDQSWRPTKTEATQGPRQKPNKTKATQGPRQRLRKAKLAHGRSGGPSKAAAMQGQSWGLIRSSSKTKTSSDPSLSPSNTEAPQSISPGSSKMEATKG